MFEASDPGVERRGTANQIGALTAEEVRDLLRRRGLSRRTVTVYLSQLRRVDRFCRERSWSLHAMSEEQLAAYLDSLPKTEGSLRQARVALSHYWRALGRIDAPQIDVPVIVGRNGRSPEQGRQAAERAAYHPQAGTRRWSETGYDELWLRDRLFARQLARKTVNVYANRLAHLAKWCGEVGSTIDTLTAAELEAYAVDLPRTRSTLDILRSALSHYFAISGRAEPPIYVVRPPRRRRMVSRALPDADARKLESAALNRQDLKGFAVILGLYLGLRRFEIASLRWSDFFEGWVTFVGKGDLEARLPAHEVVLRYMANLPRRGPFLFPGRFGGPVNPATIWEWTREVARDAGLGDVPTHVLRHTALTAANDATGDLRATQDFARHAKPETTAGYTRTSERRLREVAEAIATAYRLPSESAISSEIGSDQEDSGPALSFAELVATVEGPHAVNAWEELAAALGARPGWRLRGSLDGEGLLVFEFDPSLSSRVTAWTTDRPPTFVLARRLPSGPEDAAWWHFPGALSLCAVLAAFEAGEAIPFTPSACFIKAKASGS